MSTITVKTFFRAQTGDNWSLSQCPKISRIIITGWDTKDDKYQGSQGTCESKENYGVQQWKTLLFVVRKLYRQYEGQDQIINQML